VGHNAAFAIRKFCGFGDKYFRHSISPRLIE
jgi:hypothetical protein